MSTHRKKRPFIEKEGSGVIPSPFIWFDLKDAICEVQHLLHIIGCIAETVLLKVVGPLVDIEALQD